MTISILFLAGRLLFVVPLVLLGVDRLVDPEVSTASRLSGLVGLVGAAGVVLGVWGDVAALVAGAGVVGAVLAGELDGDDRLDAVGLLGAALVVAALYIAVGAALDLTITDPVLDLDLR